MISKLLFVFIIFSFQIFPQTNLNKHWMILNKDNSAIVSNTISAIYEGNNGGYWISSLNESFQSYLHTYYEGIWNSYDSSNSPLNKSISISDITQAKDGKLLFGTGNNGLYIKNGMFWDSLNSNNSPLPENFVFRVVVDHLNRYWLGIPNYGFAVYDNSNWIFYNDNSAFNGIGDFNFIKSDSANTIWIGTDYFGLYSFDGNNWSRRIKGMFGGGGENNMITDLAVDFQSRKWCTINLNGGGWKIGYSEDDSTWLYYDSTVIGLPVKMLSYNGIAIDKNNIKYFGTTDGLLIYNDTTWSLLDTSNSPIPGNWFRKGISDSKNNKIYILESFSQPGQDFGLIFYNQDSVVITSIENEVKSVSSFSLSQNYPNPFNPVTRIEFFLPEQSDISLTVYDMLGREIDILAFSAYPAGKHTVQFDGESHASGVYIYRLSDGKGMVIKKKMTLLK